MSHTVIGEAELPEWNVGDKWEYETPYYGLIFKEVTKVTNITTINMNGTNYDVYVVQSTGSAPWGDITECDYVTINNMAMVKKIIIRSYETNETETAITYQPPKKAFDFPLSVGKTWNFTYTSSQYDESLGYLNMTETPYYRVTGIETITVKAGTFKCYVIEESYEWGDVYLRTWYSSKVKNAVKIEDIYRITIVTELTSYSIKGMDDEDGLDILTLSYIILIFISLIILIILINSIVVRRKRKKEGTAQIATNSQPDLYTQQFEPSVPPFPESLSHQQYPCPTCGHSLSFITQYKKWFCHKCEKYV